ncbi:hypothetical protein DZB84_00025 [Bacillus sp. HNG]|nr:hypothetical protein DZB84_00025 [Bacillus sp. HNG]
MFFVISLIAFLIYYKHVYYIDIRLNLLIIVITPIMGVIFGSLGKSGYPKLIAISFNIVFILFFVPLPLINLFIWTFGK